MLKFRRKLMGALFLPLMAVVACSGLTDAEKAEYEEIKAEIARIQVEEIVPRQEQLHEILKASNLDVEELKAHIEKIRAEKLAPLEEELAALRSEDAGPLFAAPGEPVDEEALSSRLDELESLLAEQREQADAIRSQLESLRNGDVQADIELRLSQITEVQSQLEQLRSQADERAIAIQAEISELDNLLAELEPGSEDAEAISAAIADLSAEWDELHADEAKSEQDLTALIARLESEIKQLERSQEDVSDRLLSQLAAALKEIERQIHEMEQEQADILDILQPIIFGAADEPPAEEGDEGSEPEGLSERDVELEELIQEIIDTELRPLIESLNAALAGDDPVESVLEVLKTEMKDWLSRLGELRERFNELTKKSFESLLDGIDLKAIFGNLLNQQS